jgi:alanine racemase
MTATAQSVVVPAQTLSPPPLKARFWRERGLRPAAQVIDLDRVRMNAETIRRQHAGRPYFAVIKANAYGLGAPPVARALLGIADGFGVATLEEGLQLRREGITAPVLMLSGCFPQQLPQVAAAGLYLGVVSLQLLQASAEFSAGLANPLVIHLKFDTGMGRLGLLPEEAGEALAILQRAPGLKLAGLYSHFAAGEEPANPLTRAQLENFAIIEQRFREKHPGLSLHFANSAALGAGVAEAHGSRAGLALYGENGGSPAAVSLAAYPLLVKQLPAGHGVGYGPDLFLKTDTTLAVLPLGYADGVPRLIASAAWAEVAGERAEYLGRISMDLLTIRWPTSAAPDAPAWLLGHGGPRLGDWARWAQTLPYEILTGLDGRLLKIYFSGGHPVQLCLPRGGYEATADGDWEVA